MPNPEIILSIYGGVLQDVYASDPHIEMILIDWNVAGSVRDEESLVHAVHNKYLIKAFVSQPNPFSTSRTRRKRDRDTHQRGGMTIE